MTDYLQSSEHPLLILDYAQFYPRPLLCVCVSVRVCVCVCLFVCLCGFLHLRRLLSWQEMTTGTANTTSQIKNLIV